MVEALWTFKFITNESVVGAGVAVLETGRVFGGDSEYYFVGTYQIHGGEITVEVESTHYGQTPHSMFGPAKVLNLRFSGPLKQPTTVLQGNLVEAPEKRMSLHLTRQAELP